ncbi:hypothetical protein GQ54DRAFT_300176 [Martensiomyces pterosporus]|nr:hypothetical protein GQ54DRAFT_300176 [Martensiomyces pterosporus]
MLGLYNQCQSMKGLMQSRRKLVRADDVRFRQISANWPPSLFSFLLFSVHILACPYHTLNTGYSPHSSFSLYYSPEQRSLPAALDA